MKVLFIFVSLVVAIQAGYHEEVGIPRAARIKAYEDKIFGEARAEPRIWGGVVPEELAYPFMAPMVVQLKTGSTSMCAASIVNKYHLVTAATCLFHTDYLKVRVGTQYLYHGGYEVQYKEFFTHPDFNPPNTLDNDIGIVVLVDLLKYSDSVQPISLPTVDLPPEVIGETAKVAGWGDTPEGKVYSDSILLHEVSVKIVDPEVCKDSTFYENDFGHITNIDLTICTDGTGGKGYCTGDSGAPLVVERNGTKVLVGVASLWWRPCGEPKPSVFTKITKFLDFICCYQK